jgi:hypothetical protein
MIIESYKDKYNFKSDKFRIYLFNKILQVQ